MSARTTSISGRASAMPGGYLPRLPVGEVLSAVDRHYRPGDEGRLVRSEVDDHRGDFFRLTQASDRDLGNDAFEHLLGHRLDHLRIDVPGADAVDRDALPR